MDEYKGIYYGDETEQKYYEGGAHFKYIKLYKILERIARERNQIERQKRILSIRKKKYLSTSKDKNKNKMTRNIIGHLNMNKLEFNTISNNLNLTNDNNNKILISIKKNIISNKSKSNSKSKSKHKNNFSITNHKNDNDSRNKDSLRTNKGRPNTILRDRFQKIFFKRNNRLMSSSMEQKNRKKIKFPINIKRSLPEFKSLKTKKIRNNSANKKHKINRNIKINSKDNHIIDNNKSNMINININLNSKEEEEENKNNNDTNAGTNNNFNILINNNTDNEFQTDISDSNLNKMNFKPLELNTSEEEKNEKKVIENYTDVKNITENPEYFYNKLNYTNGIEISKKTHKIITKKILGNKNEDMKIRTKSLINSDNNKTGSELFNKSKDKEKIHMLTQDKSSKKKNYKTNLKKDFNIHNNTFMVKTAFNHRLFTLLQEANKKKFEKKHYMFKKSNNKKMNKNIYLKHNNNQLTYTKLAGKTRNYIGNNSSLQAKNTYNHNNINNRSRNIYANNKLKKYYKSIVDMNKTYNNGINKKYYLSNSRYKSNNKSKNKINNSKVDNHHMNNNKFIFRPIKRKIYNYSGTNNYPKTKYIIKPYNHFRTNNELKNKVSDNISIKTNKTNNINTHEISKENNNIKINDHNDIY